MAASKLKLKQGPLDVWSVRERLSLASSVLRNGDQNWVSVSRAIKPFGEIDRTPDWFSQKNCALQYSDLLEKVETPKRKRGDRGEIEAPGNQIVRKLTIERIEELKKMVMEEQQKYKKLKKEVELIKTGQWDDKLPEVWTAMQAEKAAAAELKKAATPKKSETVAQAPEAGQDKGMRPRKLIISPPSVSEPEESTQDSLIDMSNDEDSNQTIPGSSLAGELTEQIDILSPQVHPLTVPGALTKLQAIPTTPVPSFQASPGGSTLTPPSIQQTSPQTSISGRGTKTTPPSSPLLSSLLKSKHHSAEILHQMKTEVEQGQAAQALAHTLVTSPPVPSQSARTPDVGSSPMPETKKLPSPFKIVVSQSDSLSSSSGAPTLSKLLAVPAMAKSALQGHSAVTVTQSIQSLILKTELEDPELVPQAVEEIVLTTAPSSVTVSQFSTELPAPSQTPTTTDSKQDVKQETPDIKEEEIDSESLVTTETSTEIDVKTELTTEEGESQSTDQSAQSQVEESGQSALVTEEEIRIKEEPLSPCSSVSSRVSESGITRSTRKRGRGGRPKGGRRSTRLTRKPGDEKKDKDDASSKQSDGESSDDERESDGSIIATKLTPTSTTTPAFSESIPNSPLSQCSDTEDERAYKSWKKSIMLVWRAASTHKYASLFLHPVTNDIAPGYHSIVHRPMDLSVIKKNIETGMVRTTGEFQRDMMLMFTNAIMYNSSDHNVYRMAVEMYNDVLQHIEQYVSTQLMVQTNEAKILRTSRRPDTGDKEEDAKKRRTSADQLDGGKSKKRKP